MEQQIEDNGKPQNPLENLTENKENPQASKKVQQKKPLTDTQSFSKIEIIRFTGFFVIFILIIYGQLFIEDSFKVNQSIRKNYLKTIDLKQFTVKQEDIVDWLFYELIPNYFQEVDKENYGLQSIFIPVSNLRILSKRVQIDDDHIFKNPIVEEKGKFGLEGMFTYNEELHGYPQDFSYYNILQDPYEQMEDIINANFFDNQIQKLFVSFSLYNENSDMVSVVQVSFELFPSGLISHEIFLESIRMNPYQTSVDWVRAMLEAIFTGLFLYYFFQEFVKVFTQVKKQQTEWEQKWNKEEKRRKMEKEKKEKEDQQKPDYKPNKQLTQKEMFEKQALMLKQETELRIKLLKARIQNILLGLKNHVSNIWSTIDVVMIIFIALALNIWIDFFLNNPCITFLNNVNFELLLQKDLYPNYSQELFDKNIEDINNITQIFIQIGEKFNQYHIFTALSALLMSFKLLRYYISLSQNLKNNLQIIMNVMDYLLFYLILITSIIFAFAFLANFIYGHYILQFSTFYDTVVTLIGMMMGISEVSEEMIEKTKIGTFFFNLMFYFIIISILSNMFWVFVKNKLVDFELEKQKEEQSQLNIQQKGTMQVHVIVQFYEKLLFVYENFILRIFKNEKFKQITQERQEKMRMYEREFLLPEIISYDINFEDIVSTKSLLTSNTYIVESEKRKIMMMEKMEFVRLIWSSVVLLLILVINAILVMNYFKPYDQYLFNSVIRKGLEQSEIFDIETGNYLYYNDINIRGDLIKFYELIFGQLFNKYTIKDKDFVALNLDQGLKEKIKQQNGDYNLTGFAMNFYNLLAYDKLRLTFRFGKYIENPSPWKNLIKRMIPEFFKTNSDTQDNEFKDDIIGLQTNTTYKYSPGSGFASAGGYVFYFSPDQIYEQLVNLVDDNFIDDNLMSMTIDFMLINPMAQNSFTYVTLRYSFNHAGILEEKLIETKTILKNSFETSNDIILFVIQISLTITMITYLIKLLRKTFSKYHAYDKWYDLFIKNNLTEAQLHYRQQKNPELLRKLQYMLDVPQLLQISFITLLAMELIFMALLFFIILQLEGQSQVFGVSLLDLMGSGNFSFQMEPDFEQYLNLSYRISSMLWIVGPISAAVVFIMCIELVYNLTHNKDFYNVFKAISYSLQEMPFLVFMLFGFLTAFAFFEHLTLGFKFEEFSNVYIAYVTLTEFLYSITKMDFFQGSGGSLHVFVFLLPYMISARYLMLNLFFSIIYRGYMKAMEEKAEQERIEKGSGISLNLQEFLKLTLEIFSLSKKKDQHNTDFISQIIRTTNLDSIFEKMKDTLRQYKPNQSITVWAERCAEDIKTEYENREALKYICDEIVHDYVKQTNQGNFKYFSELNKDPLRKQKEYILRLKYWDYFRKANIFFNKVSIFFSQGIEQIKKKLLNQYDEENIKDKYEYYTKLYMLYLEKELENNLLQINNIRREMNKFGIKEENIIK